MRKSKFLCLLVVFVLILVIGCENNPTGNNISLDEEEIRDYVSSSLDFAEYFAFEEYYGEEDTVSAGVQSRTITNPHFWYRELQDINRDISINIVNDSAFVSFWGSVDGVFHVLEIDTETIDHQKDLIDVSTNYAIFKRYPGISAHRGWILESLTGVDVLGADILPSDCVWVYIDSLRINCASYEDTLLTSPLVFFGREELLTFVRGETVTFTLYSRGTEAYSYPYLHARILGQWRRKRFAEEIQPEVWKDYWVAPAIPGIRPIAFDVLMKSSIDDEDFEYHSNIWLFPYRIE